MFQCNITIDTNLLRIQPDNQLFFYGEFSNADQLIEQMRCVWLSAPTLNENVLNSNFQHSVMTAANLVDSACMTSTITQDMYRIEVVFVP